MCEKRISDADLKAYHEGTMDADRPDPLMHQLEKDDALAARLMTFDPAAQMVATAFEGIAPTTVPDVPVAVAQFPWKPLAIAASTVAAALAIWASLPPAGAAWHRQVAEYQVLYTAQTVSMIAPSEAALADQFHTLDAALAIDFDAMTLSDIKGLDLLRAQILGFEGAPLGQIVFADHLGRPIALCLMTGQDDADIAEAELAGLNTISWANQDHQFLLVGPVPAHELRAWFDAIKLRV